MRAALTMLLLSMSACGSGGDGATTDGAATDAAATPPTRLSFRSACAQPIDPAVGVVFPDTEFAPDPGDGIVIQSAIRGLMVFNDGPYEIQYRSNMQWTIEGQDASEFSITDAPSDYSGHSCGFHQGLSIDPAPLDPGTSCRILVTFKPTSVGPKQALLHVTLSEVDIGYQVSVDETIALQGTGVSAPSTGYANFPEIFVAPIAGNTSPTGALLINGATATADLTTLSASAPFTVMPINCPASLTTGGACLVQLTVMQQACPVGRLTTADGTFDVPLRSWGEPVPLGVDLEVTQFGSVRVDPLGQTCTGTCSYSLTDPTDLTLTAQPDAGAHFLGWQTQDYQPHPCGMSLTCTLPASSTKLALRARFASPSAKAIAISIIGSGEVSGVDLPCSTSCTRYVEPNTQVTLTEATVGMFKRWTGDCTGMSASCNLGTVINDRAVTATFNP